MDSKLLKGAGIVAGATALVAGTACFIVAPRRRDTSVDVRWEVIRRHRYAHRGLHDLTIGVPENSLPAFRRARQYGFGAELDVHLTADDQVVVIHDSDTSRMCGVPGTIEEMRLDQVRELRLAGTGEQIPTLDEVLAVFESREGEDAPAPLIVEVKSYCDDEELLTLKALAALDAHGVTYCVESFDPRVLSWLRTNRPDVVRGQLSENFLRDGRSTLAFPVALGATLPAGESLTYEPAHAGRHLYMVPAIGSVEVSGASGSVTLAARDGAAIRDEARLTFTAREDTELILVDAAALH